MQESKSLSLRPKVFSRLDQMYTLAMQGSKSLPWVLPYVHGQQAVHMESFTGTIAAFTGNSVNRI